MGVARRTYQPKGESVMPTSKHMQVLDMLGLPSTAEGPNGWFHTEEYNALRYGGQTGLLHLLRGRLGDGNKRVAGIAATALERMGKMRDADWQQLASLVDDQPSGQH